MWLFHDNRKSQLNRRECNGRLITRTVFRRCEKVAKFTHQIVLRIANVAQPQLGAIVYRSLKQIQERFTTNTCTYIIFFSGNCAIHSALKKLFYTCSALYTWEKEDEKAYLPGWVAVNESMQEELKKDPKSPWVWRSAWELKGTPYWGAFNTYWGGGKYCTYRLVHEVELRYTLK